MIVLLEQDLDEIAEHPKLCDARFLDSEECGGTPFRGLAPGRKALDEADMKAGEAYLGKGLGVLCHVIQNVTSLTCFAVCGRSKR
jgi:hypothetical protein